MALSVGKIIRKAWESSSLSQKDFASRLGISRSSLQRYMRGEAKTRAAAVSDTARIVSYGERHSQAATERYAQRVSDKKQGRYVRTQRGQRIYGEEALEVKKLYSQVNEKRSKLGLRTIRPEDFYGNKENIKNVVSRQLKDNYLEESVENGRRGFKESLRTMGERLTGESDFMDKASEALESLTPEQLDRLWSENKNYFVNLVYGYEADEDGKKKFKRNRRTGKMEAAHTGSKVTGRDFRRALEESMSKITGEQYDFRVDREKF